TTGHPGIRRAGAEILSHRPRTRRRLDHESILRRAIALGGGAEADRGAGRLWQRFVSRESGADARPEEIRNRLGALVRDVGASGPDMDADVVVPVGKVSGIPLKCGGGAVVLSYGPSAA